MFIAPLRVVRVVFRTEQTHVEKAVIVDCFEPLEHDVRSDVLCYCAHPSKSDRFGRDSYSFQTRRSRVFEQVEKDIDMWVLLGVVVGRTRYESIL